MPATINIPEKINGDFQAFLAKEKIELTTDAAAKVSVIIGEERRECSATSLYQGGWIQCATARDLKKNLEIDFKYVGKILDHLEIKVRDCQLGCF